MTSFPLEDLERLALKATPGKRERNDNRDYAEVSQANVLQAMVATSDDAEFLCATDRDAILSLIARVREAESTATVWQAAYDEIGTQLVEACDVLEFYADPWHREDESGDPQPVPDFYSELDFGERATSVLKSICSLERRMTDAQSRITSLEQQLAEAHETNRALQEHMGKTRTPGTREICFRCGTIVVDGKPLDGCKGPVVECQVVRSPSPAAKEMTP